MEAAALGTKIRELEVELDRLRGLPIPGWSEAFSLAAAEREAAVIEKRHPHLFDEVRETVETVETVEEAVA